jgi:hypothetical protein
MIEALTKRAESEGVSRSELIRQVLAKHLAAGAKGGAANKYLPLPVQRIKGGKAGQQPARMGAKRAPTG